MPSGRLLASIRVAVGALAVAATVELHVFHQAPLYFVLPWLAASVALAAGLCGRVAAGLLVLLGAYVVFGPWYKNHLYLLWLALILMAASDTERYYAVRPGKGDGASWQLFLLQFQFSVVYVFAAIAKLTPEFLGGEALQTFFERSVLSDLPGLLAISAGLAVLVVAIELIIGLGVWLPALRPRVLALMLPLHAGMTLAAYQPIDVFGIVVFAMLMMTLAASFVDVREHVVIFDGDCSFCRRWIAAFRRLDAFGALSFQPATELEAMRLSAPNGKAHSGFDAVAGVLAVLPGGYLVAPYLRLPGVRNLGHRAYRYVAAHRSCDVRQGDRTTGTIVAR
jgi:predicted DCC family thiol-disulfide oxidoreductase YuxK